MTHASGVVQLTEWRTHRQRACAESIPGHRLVYLSDGSQRCETCRLQIRQATR